MPTQEDFAAQFNDKTILRVEHSREHPYMMLQRAVAQKKTMSYEALGLLVYLLSKPDDWRIEIPDLVRKYGEKTLNGRDMVYRVLKELRERGHAHYIQRRGKNNEFGAGEWVITEEPHTDLPYTGEPNTGKPDRANRKQHNKDFKELKKGENTEPHGSHPRFKVTVYGGQDTYADGRFIDPMSGEFEAVCNHIFYAWLDSLALVGRKPDTAPDELWSQNYTATTALAKNRRTPEQIAGYVAYVYGDEADDFYKNIPTPIKLMAVANGLPGWLHDQQSKEDEAQQQRARKPQTSGAQEELSPQERAEIFKKAREQLESTR